MHGCTYAPEVCHSMTGFTHTPAAVVILFAVAVLLVAVRFARD